MQTNDTRRSDPEEDKLEWNKSSHRDEPLSAAPEEVGGNSHSEEDEKPGHWSNEEQVMDDEIVDKEAHDGAEPIVADRATQANEDAESQESPWPEYDEWTDEAREEAVEHDDTQEMPAWAQPTGALPYQPTADRPGLTPGFREELTPMNAPAMSASPLARPDTLPEAQRPTERLPLPHQPKLAEIDPTLYEYWREHINQGFQRNNRMFDTILDAFMRPYNTTIWMYRILFGLGIAAFLVAAGLGAWLREPMFSLIFGGLSIISFLTYFIGRPLQSLEENLKFITWLGIIYNTYWTRLVYSMDAESVHADLEDATQDAINEIERLLDKHHDFAGKRPGLR